MIAVIIWIVQTHTPHRSLFPDSSRARVQVMVETMAMPWMPSRYWLFCLTVDPVVVFHRSIHVHEAYVSRRPTKPQSMMKSRKFRIRKVLLINDHPNSYSSSVFGGSREMAEARSSGLRDDAAVVSGRSGKKGIRKLL